MRRADRLFRIVQTLRGGRLVTARALAERLEVSERTIYRDVRDLLLSGVPIEGEAGVGYVLRGFDLPPLMFDRREIEAVVLGVRMARAWGGERLALAAEDALRKIEAVLPPTLRDSAARTRMYALGFFVPDALRADLDALNDAIAASYRVAFAYARGDGAASEREVRPLGLFFWGGSWTLGAWCELRSDFRSFRVDRIAGLRRGAGFRAEPGRDLAAFLAAQRVEPSRPTP